MNAASKDSFEARTTLAVGGRSYVIYRLEALERAGVGTVSRLPVSLKVLLENVLRREDGRTVTRDHVEALAGWEPGRAERAAEIPFLPARVILQDFTGVPAVVDLAAMRDAVARMGGDPRRVNPEVPTDLVIDHSVQVDRFASPSAFRDNVEREFQRNRERYAFLRWGQQAFANFRAVPPDTGIVHQVNLEYLAAVVFRRESEGGTLAYPDSVLGTDSHTTMVNGLGVLGWGVGGIEAEVAMLGRPVAMLIPEVVGVRLAGRLAPGATATDLVLTVTEMLRHHGVVGKFVEFFGPGLESLALADRATIANMAPEYGATTGFFPVDGETLAYLRLTGRDEATVRLVEEYTRAQGLFRGPDDPEPVFSEVLELDLAAVEPSIAGPRRPQDRVPLREAKPAFRRALVAMPGSPVADLPEPFLEEWVSEGGAAEHVPPEEIGGLARVVPVRTPRGEGEMGHGVVVIAAITSCTNTSNPSVMIGAGLLAEKAVRRGLAVKPWVKTSLAPGSRVVTRYLAEAGLTPALEALGFHLVGYGCTTCIGNSGPLPEPVAAAVREGDLVAAAVLSGNRNFEGRINPLVRANYLASPPLVVAYAIAGTVDFDFSRQPLGRDRSGAPVYLRDIWPEPEEVREAMARALGPGLFREEYAEVFAGGDEWRSLPVPAGDRYAWDAASTYIKEPPFYEGMRPDPPRPSDIRGARALAVLGDSVTTDHISPAGAIAASGPAGRYLVGLGVAPEDFNSFGARRGNHEVMVRGTFGNIRLRNLLAPGTEGGVTRHLPDGERMTIYEAAERYRAEGVPLVVIAGKEYGTGSSRDWAAKGTRLLGVRAVLAESFERIHRSNLVGMGVLPLEFPPGQGREALGLTGEESFDIVGLAGGLRPRQELEVRARARDGRTRSFRTVARIDTLDEVEYYRHGGVLPFLAVSLLGG